MPGYADLPDNEQIERQTQGAGHLVSHRDAPTRQSENHGVLAAGVMAQALRQVSPRRATISELHAGAFRERGAGSRAR